MKFRRKKDPSVGPESAHDPDGDGADVLDEGPYDAEDLSEEEAGERIDLGSLLVTPLGGTDLRLQVDESTGEVQAVLLAGEDGAIELRAFAAPRHGDLWSEVRPQIAADLQRRGGTVGEREGRFGTELMCQMDVQLPDGSSGIQPSRVVGINGSRWMLRATFMGRPAMNPESSGEWEDALTRIAVRRGEGAMPVGEPLDVVMPPQARRVEQ